MMISQSFLHQSGSSRGHSDSGEGVEDDRTGLGWFQTGLSRPQSELITNCKLDCKRLVLQFFTVPVWFFDYWDLFEIAELDADIQPVHLVLFKICHPDPVNQTYASHVACWLCHVIYYSMLISSFARSSTPSRTQPQSHSHDGMKSSKNLTSKPRWCPDDAPECLYLVKFNVRHAHLCSQILNGPGQDHWGAGDEPLLLWAVPLRVRDHRTAMQRSQGPSV